MKLKEFGPRGGGARPKFYYVDPPLPTAGSAIAVICMAISISGSKGGSRETGALGGPNSFNFMRFFGKIWQNHMLVPPLKGWRPTSWKSCMKALFIKPTAQTHAEMTFRG